MNANETKTMIPQVKFRIEYKGSTHCQCCLRSYFKFTLNDRVLDDSYFINGIRDNPSGYVCAHHFGAEDVNAHNNDPYYDIALCLLKSSNPDLVPDEDMPEEPCDRLSFDQFDVRFKLILPDLVQISIPMRNQNPPLLTEETLLNTVHELLDTCSQISKIEGWFNSDSKRIMQHALEGLCCDPSTAERWLEWLT
jgi:hypothetical protein